MNLVEKWEQEFALSPKERASYAVFKKEISPERRKSIEKAKLEDVWCLNDRKSIALLSVLHDKQEFKEWEERLFKVIDLKSEITTSASNLVDPCRQLIHEQRQDTQKLKEIDEVLQYFSSYDEISNTLRVADLSFIFQPNFLMILHRIDQCKSYLEKHLEYFDSLLYIEKYHQCTVRALCMIRDYYLKNKTSSQKMKPLISEIENRVSSNDINSIFQDCVNCYFRRVQGRIEESISKFKENYSVSLLESVPRAIDFVSRLMSDEIDEFNRSLSENDAYFKSLLEFDSLIQFVRPIILQEEDIGNLLSCLKLLPEEIGFLKRLRGILLQRIIFKAEAVIPFMNRSELFTLLHNIKETDQKVYVELREIVDPLMDSI